MMPQATRKTRRAGLKSMASNNSTSKSNNGANLNGLKDVDEKIMEAAMDVDASVPLKIDSKQNTNEDTITDTLKPEKPTKGRKRKASEMKSNSISEEPPAKDKPISDDESKEEPTAAEEDKSDTAVSNENENNDYETKDDFDFDNKSLQKETTSSHDSSSELSVHEFGTLGKGKRARIPNKRYSDFPLKALPKLNENEIQSTLENGAVKEGLDSGSNTDASEHSGSVTGSPSVPSVKPARVSLSTSPALLQKKRTNIENPNYLKPFHFGWKRELVYRATLDNSIVNKRNGDIYYYTPNGRKVRSMREVAEHLKTTDLTLDDFTFCKEPLGLDDPEKEIIRDAKNKSAIGTPLIKKITPKLIKTPKIMSPKVILPSSQEKEKEPKIKHSPRVAKNFKIKLLAKGGSKSKVEKKPKDDSGGDMELGTYPPNWSPVITKKTKKVGKSTLMKRKKKRRSKAAAPVIEQFETTDGKLITSYLQNVAYGYNTLLYVFQYLKVQDLLRASCVCSMWRDIASHSVLWKTVRMKNSQIHSFGGLADALQKHGTNHLDLRKMLLPNNGNDDIWQEFSREIKKVESLKKIELCRCPATVVEQLALSNPKLQVINAVTIKCESMSLAPLVFLKDLQELRLKSTAGFSLTSDLTALSDLKELTHLSLTSIKDLNKLNIDVIADLRNLESLDLGECSDFSKTFGSEILTRLNKLEKLRLEKGQGNCYTFEILEAVKNMTHLEQLELVNFDIKAGFDKALGACTNIKKLLIIPTYISQSATTNHMVLGGVLRLQNNLSHFVWGITLELLRVTELFVDQCEDAEKKEKKEKKPIGNGDSIPVLKPVPLLKGVNLDIPPAQDPPQVEILPLPNLQKLLLQSLPTTRVKILKIPFHATWRQSITDTVN